MGNSKVIRDFSSGRYSDYELIVKASHAIEQMTGNAAFTAPDPPLTVISAVNKSL